MGEKLEYVVIVIVERVLAEPKRYQSLGDYDELGNRQSKVPVYRNWFALGWIMWNRGPWEREFLDPCYGQ